MTVTFVPSFVVVSPAPVNVILVAADVNTVPLSLICKSEPPPPVPPPPAPPVVVTTLIDFAPSESISVTGNMLTSVSFVTTNCLGVINFSVLVGLNDSGNR